MHIRTATSSRSSLLPTLLHLSHLHSGRPHIPMFRFRDTFLLFFQLNTQHTHYSKRGFFAFSMNGKLEGLGEDQPELGGGEVETFLKRVRSENTQRHPKFHTQNTRRNPQRDGNSKRGSFTPEMKNRIPGGRLGSGDCGQTEALRG
jgi:hypothetical protein